MSAELAPQIEAAFDYRGFVTVTKRDGSSVVGFVYDRTPSHIELYDETATHRIRVPVSEIDKVALSGEDIAAKAQRIWERRIDGLESPDTSAYGDWDAQRGALVIVAMPGELRRVSRAIGAKPRGTRAIGRLDQTTVVVQSIGIAGDVRAAARAIAAEKPRLVIACGLSGAVDAGLTTGDVVIGERVNGIAADAKLVAAARAQLPDAAVGEIASVSTVATTPEAKQRLLPALAVDLETAAIAEAARAANVPWLAVRAIVDPVDLVLPELVTRRDGFVIPALRFGIRHPIQLADLAWRARRAQLALQRAIGALAPAVHA